MAMKDKLKEKWEENKPTILYIASLAGVSAVSLLVVRDATRSGMIKELSAEKKRLKSELQESDDIAWQYHDLSMDLLYKYKPSQEELNELRGKFLEQRFA